MVAGGVSRERAPCGGGDKQSARSAHDARPAAIHFELVSSAHEGPGSELAEPDVRLWVDKGSARRRVSNDPWSTAECASNPPLPACRADSLGAGPATLDPPRAFRCTGCRGSACQVSQSACSPVCQQASPLCQ